MVNVQKLKKQGYFNKGWDKVIQSWSLLLSFNIAVRVDAINLDAKFLEKLENICHNAEAYLKIVKYKLLCPKLEIFLLSCLINFTIFVIMIVGN